MKKTVLIRLDKIVYGGGAIGRDENNKIIFVNQGLPGELVEVKIVERKRDYLIGEIINIVEPSDKFRRISPVCKYFGICGGCQWQHIDYQQQLVFKEEIVKEQFIRIGKISQPQVTSIIGTDTPWGYRNKSKFIVRAVDNKFIIGFHRNTTRGVVDVEYCHLLPQIANQVYEAVRIAVKKHLKPFRYYCGLEIKTSDTGVIISFLTSPKFQDRFDNVANELQDVSIIKGLHHIIMHKKARYEVVTYFGTPVAVYHINNLTFQVQPPSFFQINISQAQKLFNKAVEFIAPEKHHQILDAYCGVGVLSLLTAGLVDKVVGVDISETSIKDAKWNAQLNNINNVYFFQSKMKKAVRELKEYQFNSVILNPPREGIVEKKVFRWLADNKPPKIIYISCNPTTLARDLSILCDIGYSISTIQPVDMFPQTYHVEDIAVLELR
jgi:23S rRNA (uracil1939-C5)-methyltransferase